MNYFNRLSPIFRITKVEAKIVRAGASVGIEAIARVKTLS